MHQAVEAKEGVQIDRETQTLATITIQNYFRLYHKLGGMTGTAETEANEFHDIYKLDVVVIPTNRAIRRADGNDRIYKTRREKYNAVVAEVKECHGRGQPVLVGTASVDSSEVLSRMLKREKIPHSVLNAKYHRQEAEIVARAGQKETSRFPRTWPGRGTDIKLGEGVAELGGLNVLGHGASRIPPHRPAVARPLCAPGRSGGVAFLRQLRGRSDAQFRRVRPHDHYHGAVRAGGRPGTRASRCSTAAWKTRKNASSSAIT